MRTATPKAPVPPPDWKALADRYALKVLAGLIVLALALRLPNLTALSLWVDEYVHVLRAKNFVQGTGPLFTDDNNGILLTFILLPLFKIFGSGVFWARLPSVLFGAGMVYLVYRLGERLFNRYVGLMAAFFCTFSLYLVFWSRMARNYAIFGFFFLLLGWVFLKAYEGKTDPESRDFFQKNGFSIKYLLLLPVVFVAALLSHQLAFFFLFTLAAYTVAMTVSEWIQYKRLAYKYLWPALLLLPLLLIALVPAFGGIARNLLGLVLPERIAQWVVPDWAYLSAKWKSEPWISFGIYHGVMRYDPTLLYFPAVAGLGAAFWLNRRSGWWLLCSFLVPFLLMSFVFREPSVPRYAIFIFPYFMISAAAFFYFVWKILDEKYLTNASNTVRYAVVALPFVFGLFSVRWGEIADLTLARKTSGVVSDRNLGSFNFSNWQGPGNFVLDRKKPGDVMLSTVPAAAAYYLREDSVLWFRQRFYNTTAKRYELFPPNPGAPNAQNYQDLKRLVQNNTRGWLLADYYMDNVLVDDSCRYFVYRNMHFYPEAAPDATVLVFGWDNSQPKPVQQNLIAYLNADKIVSREINYLFTPEMLARPKLTMTVRTKGIDTPSEAFVLVNGEVAYYLPPNNSNNIETTTVEVETRNLRPGGNRIEVYYDVDKV
ncbi:MAG TPA: glycosyltransferase family 39 protein, partial [Saprospiraceae bacterium]|nr:glycosyltransferase family 39 protein [Saprospiraceae bacterium]